MKYHYILSYIMDNTGLQERLFCLFQSPTQYSTPTRYYLQSAIDFLDDIMDCRKARSYLPSFLACSQLCHSLYLSLHSHMRACHNKQKNQRMILKCLQ